MIELRRGHLLFLCIILLLLVSFSPHPEPAIALDEFQELLDQAPYVLTGYVTKIESYWDTQKTQIYSDVTILVEETLRGIGIGTDVVVRHLGGEVEGLGQIVSHEPSFTLGERVRVYLSQCEDGKFSVVAGDRGKTSLSASQNSEDIKIMQGKQIVNSKTTNSLSSSLVYYAYTGIHWGSSSIPVQYYINQAGTVDTTGEFEAVQNSFQTWEDDTGSNIDYTYMGTTTGQGGTYDGYNVVSWGSLSAGTLALAQCTTWYYTATLLIAESDIVFNDDYAWSTTGAAGKYDVQNIGTHEVGHTLHLKDLYAPECSELTMYGYVAAGETKKRTLDVGDVAGVRFIYPVSSSSVTVYAEADAYVDSDYPTSNYGGSSYLYVRNAYDSAFRISYLRFDLASIPSNAEIQSAVLQVYNWYLFSATTKIGVHYSSNTTWSEAGITWNNKPSYEILSGSNQTVVTEYCWYAWDITTITQSTLSGKLTVVLKTEGIGDLFSTSFYSRDYTTAINRPRLNVIYIVPDRTVNLRTNDWSGNILPQTTVTIGTSSKISDSNGWANFTVVSGQTYLVTAKWGGTKVNQTSIDAGSSSVTMDLRCRVWNLTVNARDSLANLLPLKGSRLLITLPNGTHIDLPDVNSASLKVMNGTFYFASKWQNSQVYGNLSVPLDVVNSTYNMICKVYSLKLKNRDHLGNLLNQSIILSFPNGTSLTKTASSGWINMTHIQNGTITLGTPILISSTERYVLLNSTTVSLSTNQMIDSMVWRHDYKVTIGFKDDSGTHVLSRPSSFTILTQNGTANNPPSNSWLPAGTATLTAITWQGSNVRPQIPPTITISSGITYYFNVRVYHTAFLSAQFKDSDGIILYWSPSSFKLTFPNNTVSTYLSVGSSYFIQNGTTTWSSVTWQGTEVTPSTTFDVTNGNPSVNCKVYFLNIKNKDHLNNLLTRDMTLTFPNGTSLTKTPSSGWINMTQVQTGSLTLGTPLIVSTTERYVLLNSTSIPLTSSTTIVADVWRHDFKVTIGFKDNSGNYILSNPSSFTILMQNGTSMNNPSANAWMPAGTTTLTLITWQSSNVRPQNAPTITIGSATTYYFDVRVYYITLASSQFKDSGGTTLYVSPSSLKLKFPNGTISSSLKLGNYFIQNGTTQWSSIIWYGSEVSPNTTFDAANGNPTVNCKVYSLNVKNRDHLNNPLTEAVTLAFPNGTALVKTPSSGWINITQVQTGTIALGTPITVSTTERYVLLNSTSISLISSTTSVETWRHDFKVTVVFKDDSGTYVLSTPSDFAVLMQNGTSIRNPLSNVWMPSGTATLTSATWQGSNIRPQTAPTITINSTTTYYYNVRVYRITFNSSQFKASDGTTLYSAPSSFKLTFPNNTVSSSLSLGQSCLIQNGTTRWNSITWQGTEVTPLTTFDAANGNPTVDCTIYSLKINPTFTDNDGSALYVQPSSWSVKLPNSTLRVLSTLTTYNQIQGGNYSVTSIIWQGTEVAPDSKPITTLTSDYSWSPIINCKVYSLSFNFKDNSGSITIHPTQWVVKAPNDTISSALTRNITQAQTGTWELVSITWQGNNIIPSTHPTTPLAGNQVWTVNCRVYKVDFTGSFKDSKGLGLSTKASGFSLLSPNGSSTELLPLGAYMLQNGTFKLRFISWKGFEILPISELFDAADGNPSIDCTISDLTITVKDIIGLTTSGAKVNIIYAANGTTIVTATTNMEGKATFPQLPDNNYRMEVTLLDSTSKSFTLAGGDKAVEVTVLLSYPVIVILLVIAVTSIGIIVLVVRRRHH